MKPEDYIGVFKDALEKVPKEYYNWKSPESVEKTERVFCYELYHQFRLLLDQDRTLRLDGEITKRKYLVFHGETSEGDTKPNNDIRDLCGINIEVYKPRFHNFFTPDFVLHGGQDNDNKQIMAIEVKTKWTKSVITDVLKLNFYITKFKFETAILLVTNCDHAKIKQELQLAFNSKSNPINNAEWKDSFSKIYVISCVIENNNKTINSDNIIALIE